jgi:hypothetical protein
MLLQIRLVRKSILYYHAFLEFCYCTTVFKEMIAAGGSEICPLATQLTLLSKCEFMAIFRDRKIIGTKPCPL